MVFEKDGYVLHSKVVKLKGQKPRPIYFFCKKGNKPKSGAKADKPDNMKVGKNKRTGLPYLKKK